VTNARRTRGRESTGGRIIDIRPSMNYPPHMSAVLDPKPAAPDLGSAAAARAALRTFWRLAEAWQLEPAEQATLLGVGRTTLYQWKQGKLGAALDRHVLERLSYLFGIYAALQILLPVSQQADAWVRKPNTAPLFGGGCALDRMLGGQVADLFVVREYLDAQRGGKA
jgi:hypothetical protein